MAFLLEARNPRGLNRTKWAVLGIYIIYIYNYYVHEHYGCKNHFTLKECFTNNYVTLFPNSHVTGKAFLAAVATKR